MIEKLPDRRGAISSKISLDEKKKKKLIRQRELG